MSFDGTRTGGARFLGGVLMEKPTEEILREANENLRQANRYILLAAVFTTASAVILIATVLLRCL